MPNPRLTFVLSAYAKIAPLERLGETGGKVSHRPRGWFSALRWPRRRGPSARNVGRGSFFALLTIVATIAWSGFPVANAYMSSNTSTVTTAQQPNSQQNEDEGGGGGGGGGEDEGGQS